MVGYRKTFPDFIKAKWRGAEYSQEKAIQFDSENETTRATGIPSKLFLGVGGIMPRA